MTCIDDGWSSKTFRPSQPTYDRIGSTRKFGVELEFDGIASDYEDLETNTLFGAKEDCSVDGGEFDSPILYGDQGLAECENLLDLMEGSDWFPGSQSGYHLHCDVGDESAARYKSIALAYHYTYGFWKGTVTRGRRNNTYCKSHVYRVSDIRNIGDTTNSIRSFTDSYDRYAWCNVASYGTHGTIELRIHEGTKSHKDVVNWAIAHTRFIDAAADMSTGQITRTFGGTKTASELFREIRVMIAEPVVSEHLATKFRTQGADLLQTV